MTVRTHAAEPTCIEVLEATHRRGERYEIEVRGHRVPVDQPVGAGGDDTAPPEVEISVAGRR